MTTDNLEAYRWYVLGLDKARALETADAIAAFEKAVQTDPQFAMAYGRIGYAYALVHWEPDRARPYLETAFRLSGRLTDKDRANIAAWYSIAHREYEEAIAAYRRIIERYPDELEAYWRLGVLLDGEERFEETLAVLERGRSVDPVYPEIHNALGNVYLKLRRPREAIAMFQRYVELAPSVANAHDSLGLGYHAAGDSEHAIASFQRALELSPDFEVALIHLGNAHFLRGRYRQALTFYDRYIAASDYDRDRSRGYACKAWVEFTVGDAAAAWRDAQRSVALSSLHLEPIRIALRYGKPHARDWIARHTGARTSSRGARASRRGHHVLEGDLALSQGDTTAAVTHYSRATALAPLVYLVEWWEDAVAEAYAAAGRHDLAIKEYERVLGLYPHLGRVRFKYAQTLERVGQTRRAHEEFTRFRDHWRDADTDGPEVTAARQRLAVLGGTR